MSELTQTDLAPVLELATLVNGNVMSQSRSYEEPNPEAVHGCVVGFAKDANTHSFAVEVRVDVRSAYGDPRKIHVEHSWSSNGNRSIMQMQLGLSQAAAFIELVKNWGFSMEVEVH